MFAAIASESLSAGKRTQHLEGPYSGTERGPGAAFGPPSGPNTPPKSPVSTLDGPGASWRFFATLVAPHACHGRFRADRPIDGAPTQYTGAIRGACACGWGPGTPIRDAPGM